MTARRYPFVYEPDTTLDDALYICPDCGRATELVRGATVVRCSETGREIIWQEIYAYTIKHWAQLAMRAAKAATSEEIQPDKDPNGRAGEVQ